MTLQEAMAVLNQIEKVISENGEKLNFSSLDDLSHKQWLEASKTFRDYVRRIMGTADEEF